MNRIVPLGPPPPSRHFAFFDPDRAPMHRIEDLLITKRLRQKIDRSRLHRPYRHRDIAISRHEDDWNPDAGIGQLGLEIEAAQSRHSDIKDDTADNIRKF